MELVRACRGADLPGDLDGLTGILLRLREGPVQHPDLGERCEHERPLAGGCARRQLDSPAVCNQRAVVVTGVATVAAEALVQERQPDPIAPGVQTGDRRLDERARPPGTAGRERRLRRRGLENRQGSLARRGGGDRARLDRLPSVGYRVRRPALPPGVPDTTGPRQPQHRLEMAELVRRRVDAGRPVRRLQSGLARPGRLVRGKPVPPGRDGRAAEGRGKSGVMARPLERQEVTVHGPRDQLVAEIERPVERDEDAVLDGLRDPGRQVRVEVGAAASRRGRGTGRESPPLIVERLERLRDRRQPGRRQRPAGRREQPQGAPAFRSPQREAGDYEVVEGAGQRAARELAAGGDQLLRDERTAAGPLGHENEHAGRGTFALDPLDELGQLMALQRPDLDPLGGPCTLTDPGQARGQRVAARQLVRLPCGDETQRLVPGDPGEERDEVPRRRVGAVEILEDEDDRTRLAEAAEHAQHALEHACLSALRGDDGRARRQDAELTDPWSQFWQETDNVLRAGQERVAELRVGKVEEHRPERADHRRVCAVRPVRASATTQERERRGEHGHAQRGFVEEAAHADARTARDEHRARSTGGRAVECGGQEGERPVPPDEPRARELRGHVAF